MADSYTVSRVPTDREAGIVDSILRDFAEFQGQRTLFASQWEEVAELIYPAARNTFFYGSANMQGGKKADRQIDASGMLALSRFSAICDSLLTPRNQTWHGLKASDDYVMKDRATRLWFEDTARRLFKFRYAAEANFTSQNQSNFQSLGAFGMMAMFVDAFDYTVTGARGLRYKSIPIGELFVHENHQGLIDGFIRWFRYTARQAYQKWPNTFPDQLRPALEKGSTQEFNFLHRLVPNTEYDFERLDAKGMKFASCYVSIEGRTLLQEGGYKSFPLAPGRYDQAPGEVYGRGPAMMVLPSLKTLNAQKRVFLKQGHRAGDPVLLTSDDGLIDFSLRPGALNKGGVNADGKPLVQILPSGNIQITEEMMDKETKIIDDVFLVSLFQILTETPQMTATEVIERTNEKGILIAPTVGRQEGEYLGVMIPRELDVLSQQGLLLPMPPRLREAEGAYSIVYTSPLARAARAQQAAGFLRTLESVKELVNITQDPALLDPFDFDTAIPAIAEIEAVPESWMSSEEQIAQKRQNRQQATDRQQQVQEAPAKAAMMKAQAAQVKAGMGQQQTSLAPAQGAPPGITSGGQ